MSTANGAIEAIMTNMAKNSENIDNMNDIVKAVIEEVSLNTVQNQVDKFLKSYSDYTPGVTKTDLVDLNTKYEQMLDSFEKTFTESSTLCQIALSGAAAKVREAKAIWASINSLLGDIYDKQFELINALVKVVRSKLDESAAKTIEPEINYNFELLVRRMLAVRVAAQQVCDSHQLLQNDIQDKQCENIRDKVFLPKEDRDKIKERDERLRQVLDKYPTNEHIVYIPVSKVASTLAIKWDDLITGKITEFVLPANNMAFLRDNGWIDSENQLTKALLLKSIEIFIPVLLPSEKTARLIREFSITAIQDSVVVNGKANAQRYTIKLRHSLVTTSRYTLNEATCAPQNIRDNLFDNGAKYCIPDDSGRFGENLQTTLPVSMFSKFQIQLTTGYDKADWDTLRALYPVDDTLKLRARIRVYSNPGGQGHQRSSRPIDSARSQHPPVTGPCGEGQYRRIINAQRQECVPCPDVSVPFAQGIYCISQEAAMKLAEKGITSG
jgi:hypothetical protein